jgi:two-component system phosphate regulon sensor histidine kinase PhoR
MNILAFVVFGLIVSDWLQRQIVEQVDRRLHDAAYQVREEFGRYIPAGRTDELQQLVRRVGQQTETRFTVVAWDGTVLADSQRATLADVAKMDNHRDRHEVAMARGRGERTAVRTSETLAEPLRYFALRVEANGKPIGIVRSAIPVAAIDAQRAAVRRLIWGLLAVTCLLVLGLAYWIVSRLVRPISALTEAAEAIASGDYQHRVYISSRDELGTLATTFNRLVHELNGRMTQLGQTSDRHSTVLGGMIEGVIAVDVHQRVVLANHAAGQLFDFRPPVAEGRPLREVVRNHALGEAVTASLTTRKPQRLEIKSNIPHPPSNIQHVDIHVQPLPGEPCPGAVLVMHDTTELRRLESLRRDFVANVSHELKTPLSSIKAYTETLRNGAMSDPETSGRFLQRIEEQSDRLHHLIVDLLMLARIESDQQAFEIVPVDVAAVATACIVNRREAAAAKRIELAIEPNQPTCRVRADVEGLREILDNLIDNAIKFTPDGGKVTVSWQCDGCPIPYPKSDTRHPTPDTRPVVRGSPDPAHSSPSSNIQHPPSNIQQPTVRIAVHDTGIGIREEDQRRVFERFFRVDKARSRELGGTGLGLAIVKHLAQSFGGKVGVTSEPGRGSTFTVELPLA